MLFQFSFVQKRSAEEICNILKTLCSKEVVDKNMVLDFERTNNTHMWKVRFCCCNQCSTCLKWTALWPGPSLVHLKSLWCFWVWIAVTDVCFIFWSSLRLRKKRGRRTRDSISTRNTRTRWGICSCSVTPTSGSCSSYRWGYDTHKHTHTHTHTHIFYMF